LTNSPSAEAVLWILVLLAICGGVVAWQRYRRSPKQLRRKQIAALRRACGGDQELVERLIFGELQRNPKLDYAEAARRALERLARDRRV
jgi:phage terminase small subunit